MIYSEEKHWLRERRASAGRPAVASAWPVMLPALAQEGRAAKDLEALFHF
jgi:hypothetical protein